MAACLWESTIVYSQSSVVVSIVLFERQSLEHTCLAPLKLHKHIGEAAAAEVEAGEASRCPVGDSRCTTSRATPER